MATDITDQVNARKIIERSELKLEREVHERMHDLHIQNETFKQAEENSGQGSYSYNLTTNTISYSNNLFRLLGFEPNDFPTSLETFFNLVHPEDRAIIQTASEALLHSDAIDHRTYRMITKSGNIIYIKGTGKIIKSNSEKILVGTLQDVTQDKIDAEKLQISENFNRTVLDVLPNVISIYDLELKQNIFVSKNIFTLLGYSDQDLLNTDEKNLHGLNHPADRAVIDNFLNEALLLGDGETLELEHRLKNKKNEYVHVISRCTPYLRNEKKELKQVLSIIVNIDDIKKSQAELQRKNIELESSNSELASFSYIASHDLKEPLRKIEAFSRRIAETETFSEKTQDYFSRIISAGERMQNLIDALLEFSRANTSDLTFECCDLNQVLKESTNYLKETIAEKDAVIEAGILPVVEGFNIQLTQLFTNFLDNAIKYAKPGAPPQIFISCVIIPGEEIKHPFVNTYINYYRINISDNGIGFDQQYENKIFDLFKRLHGKNEYSGTGIGLAICKKIASNHKGFIIAQGNPKIGATFSFYIPASNILE